MSALFEALQASKEFSPKDRREALKPFCNPAGIKELFSMLPNEPRLCLRALCDISASGASSETVAANLTENHSEIAALLRSDDAKSRKSCAELAGRLRADEFCAELCDALSAEDTDFVLPSIILALGQATHSMPAKEALERFTVSGTCAEKHRIAQQAALSKALARHNAKELKPHINELPKGTKILLRCPSANLAVRELREMHFHAQSIRGLSNCATVTGVSDYHSVFKARSFYDASILFGTYGTLEDAQKAACSDKFAILCHTLFGDELPYRVELCAIGAQIGHGIRKQCAETIAASLSARRGFANNPSAYLFEILIILFKNAVVLSIVPSARMDKRFEYRRRSVPASIHPAAAAACMRLCRKYFSADHNVLDCFCGSGTMLFERAFFPYASLSGSDISASALSAAKENELAAEVRVKFFTRDAVSPFSMSYDEIISNMPFGLRVGTHEHNLALYKAFFENLSSLLSPHGTAMLFTHEKRLLMETLPENFSVIERHTFSCGGLSPDMFIIERR